MKILLHCSGRVKLCDRHLKIWPEDKHLKYSLEYQRHDVDLIVGNQISRVNNLDNYELYIFTIPYGGINKQDWLNFDKYSKDIDNSKLRILVHGDLTVGYNIVINGDTYSPKKVDREWLKNFRRDIYIFKTNYCLDAFKNLKNVFPYPKGKTFKIIEAYEIFDRKNLLLILKNFLFNPKNLLFDKIIYKYFYKKYNKTESNLILFPVGNEWGPRKNLRKFLREVSPKLKEKGYNLVISDRVNSLKYFNLIEKVLFVINCDGFWNNGDDYKLSEALMLGTPILKVKNRVYHKKLLKYKNIYREFNLNQMNPDKLYNLIVDFTQNCERNKQKVKDLFNEVWGTKAIVDLIINQKID